MKKHVRIGVSVITTLAFASVLCAIPPRAHSQAKTTQTAPATHSVSGKVASVSKNSFTLTLAGEKISSSPTQATPKTMSFLVDNNTTIEGKLQVGANADVTYREDGGSNVAISVRVAP